jgi:hypothetical protein
MASERWIHQIHRKNLGFLAIAFAWPYAASKSESGFNPNFPRVLLARLPSDSQTQSPNFQEADMASEGWIHQIHRKNLGFLAIASAWPYAASIKGDGMHTWIGMVGYCMKTSEHPDLRNFIIGVSEADIEAGRAVHLRLGAGELKYRTALTSRNIFSKALVFLCESLPGILNF